MSAAIAKVSRACKGMQGVGMLYYAGYDIQLDWQNYMVPADAVRKTAADVTKKTIDLGSLIDIFKAATTRLPTNALAATRHAPR